MAASTREDAAPFAGIDESIPHVSLLDRFAYPFICSCGRGFGKHDAFLSHLKAGDAHRLVSRVRHEEIMALHIALVQIQKQLVEYDVVPSAAFERYERCGVKPTNVDRTLGEHWHAVACLMGDLQTALGLQRRTVARAL